MPKALATNSRNLSDGRTAEPRSSGHPLPKRTLTPADCTLSRRLLNALLMNQFQRV